MEQANNAVSPADELALLKSRADLMGLTYHPSIGLDKLRDKVLSAQNGDQQSAKGDSSDSSDDDEPAKPGKAKPVVAVPAVESTTERRHRLKREATKLVRIRVTCMNPAKKEWDGEIFTAGNAGIGSVKKFVPFNAEDGWHVPHIIFQVMKDRMCQIFISASDERGNKIRKGKLIREFAIEIMDPLTEDELAELAARQAATKSIE